MNLKKYLQKQAEKDAENLLTEADKLFCLQLAQLSQTEDTKKRRKRRKKNETTGKQN